MTVKTVVPLLLLSGVVGVAVPTLVVRTAGTGSPAAATRESQGTGTVGSAAAPSAPSTTAKAKPESKDDKGVFGISGSVTELVPGTTRPLVVTITNPNGYAIDVLSVTTTVGSPGGGCPAGSLVVPPYAYSSGPAVSAPGKGSTTLTLSAQYVDSLTADQSGCRGATFPLTFTGTAEKATKK